MPVSDKELLQKARDVMKNAHCPYSNFPVGSALLTEDDTVFLGVNCENASYGGGICAERNAMTTALAQGYRKFKAIAVSQLTKLGEVVSYLWKMENILVSYLNIRSTAEKCTNNL
ncbi:putative cytidine deaminase [Ancylostoma duodenale]|uniref:Putative cytidine deaminase n=1 Tax=Ancylostoma duodenale TaxID=51022 RepID=A0A0C2GXR6_9BILA|nr:putative cytidine deaminase [Ancylostoma duodenale]